MKNITLEEIERNDWGDEITKEKSISAYYLPRWINDMKQFTFKTDIVKIKNLKLFVPDPKLKYIVKWESKSPKDSDNWGPINGNDPNFYEKVENLFFTSLRCKTKQDIFYCFREYIELEKIEYRCFYNRRLFAVGAQTHEIGEFNNLIINKILNFVDKISSFFPYYRCVFDLAFQKENNELIFIEFNSWETNSGGFPFDWIDDTVILYPESGNAITFRWNKNDTIVNHGPHSNMYFKEKFLFSTEKGDYYKTIYLFWYVDGILKYKKRGIYRFCKIITENNFIILIEDNKKIILNYDLSKK